MGAAGESRMTAHQSKKLDIEALKEFRDRFGLPLRDEAVAALTFYRPAPDSPEMRYLRERRAALGGLLPARRRKAAETLAVPPLASYAGFAIAGGREGDVDHDGRGAHARRPPEGQGARPAHRSDRRRRGADLRHGGLFRQIGIYAPSGQLYEPEDAGSLLAYREARDGQLLEEGITEAGAMSSWTAAATSYSVHGLTMLPFYIYYSMFGFQRVGDLIWAAADQRARGFLLGATAGRTTLAARACSIRTAPVT